MALINFGNRNSSNSNNGNSQAGVGLFGHLSAPTNDRPQSQVWMNFGYQAGDKFISVPIGVAIDTMQPIEIRGQNEDYIKQATAQNALLKALQDAGNSLQPGQEVDVNLMIKLRRVKGKLEIADADNEYMGDFSGMFAQAAE